jgi:putative chitinase
MRKKFYDIVRSDLFGGLILPSQFEGIEATINEAESRKIPNEQLAYILATEYHETDKTMQPIEEYGKGVKKTYGRKIKYSGQPYFKPDKIYFGRGHTQNTWYEVYERLTQLAKFQGKDWDFLNNPELLLQMEKSIWATFEGMTKGIYTGKKLSDYFNAKQNDPVNARRIINGTDKAQLISEYYNVFLKALQA